MNLDELRTPHPLRDSDFAAIRARVRAEIAERRERPWLAILMRFGFAAISFVAFVPYVVDRTPPRPHVEVAVQAVQPQPVTHNPKPVTREAHKRPSRQREEPAHPREPQTATRIEIHTADPTIRIIWLTQPKENNS